MEILTIVGMYFDVFPLKYISSFGEVKLPMANRFHIGEIFTAAIIPLGIFFYYLKPSKIKIVFLAISFIGILASTSRTAIIASICSVILFILIKNRWRIFNKEFVVFFLIIIISSFIAFEVSPKIQQRVESFKTTFGINGGDMMSGRFYIYQETWNRIKDKPIVGHGIKNSTLNNFILTYHGGKEVVKHSHNIWLELLYDSGVIGFFSFLLFLIYFLYKICVRFNHCSLIHKATIYATFGSIFLSSLASWSVWSGNQIGSFFVIIFIAYGINSLKIENKLIKI